MNIYTLTILRGGEVVTAILKGENFYNAAQWAINNVKEGDEILSLTKAHKIETIIKPI